MNLPCCVHSECLDPSNPFSNLSAEKPDQDIFIGYSTGFDNIVPFLGDTFFSTGCTSFCQSTISQADADACAARQWITCTVAGGPQGDGGGGNGWKDPGKNPVPLFANQGETCTIICPDGLPFRYTVGAGQYLALSQGDANAIALSVACTVGQSEAMCLPNIPGTACLNQFYSTSIFPSGGTTPFNYSIINGSLPPGINISQSMDTTTLFISGTPTATGTFTFTVQISDRFGLFFNKTYTISVMTINMPKDAQNGVPYTFSFTVTGGTPPYTFALSNGALPAGLSMDASGNITGTPTVNGMTLFSVSVTDSSP